VSRARPPFGRAEGHNCPCTSATFCFALTIHSTLASPKILRVVALNTTPAKVLIGRQCAAPFVSFGPNSIQPFPPHENEKTKSSAGAMPRKLLWLGLPLGSARDRHKPPATPPASTIHSSAFNSARNKPCNRVLSRPPDCYLPPHLCARVHTTPESILA